MSGWLVPLGRPSEDPRVRIVAIPWAGAGAGAFRKWPALLPPDVALQAVRLPGRESRFRERRPRHMDEVVAGLAPVVAETAALPTVIFGYSLGALIAYELTVRLEAIGAPPVLLAVGGVNAPHVARPGPRFSELDDDALVAALGDLQGAQDQVLQHAELRALLLPTVRADLAIVDRYVRRHRTPLDVAVRTFRGTDDPELTAAGVAAWADVTVAAVAHHAYPGGHFFLADRPEDLVDDLLAEIVALVPAP